MSNRTITFVLSLSYKIVFGKVCPKICRLIRDWKLVDSVLLTKLSFFLLFNCMNYILSLMMSCAHFFPFGLRQGVCYYCSKEAVNRHSFLAAKPIISFLLFLRMREREKERECEREVYDTIQSR